MAFSLRNLSVLAYANGFTLWHYKAEGEGADTASRPDFFRDAGDMLTPGDMVLVSTASAARIVYVTPGKGGLGTAPLG